MKNFSRYKILLALLATVLLSTYCNKETKLEPMAKEPLIKNVLLNTTQIKADTDTLIFTIEYQDGDGDLGEDKIDINNIFIYDSRLGDSKPEAFRLARLKPGEEPIPIQGKIIIKMPNIPIIVGDNTEICTFGVEIVDRAGNKSNMFNTREVTIVK